MEKTYIVSRDSGEVLDCYQPSINFLNNKKYIKLDLRHGVWTCDDNDISIIRDVIILIDIIRVEKIGLTNRKIYVKGDINISYLQLEKIPFGNIEVLEGNFNCSHNIIRSLKGSPSVVNGDFDCSNNVILKPDGCPDKVTGDFIFKHNILETLRGFKTEIRGDLDISFNELLTLSFCPNFYGTLNCSYNNLINLLGINKTIYGDLDCSNNRITSYSSSFEYLYGNLICHNNNHKSVDINPKSIHGRIIE